MQRREKETTLEVLRRPISGVVSEGFIPSVPCCVIVISLQGPTSTDEVSPSRQSRRSGPRPGLPRSPHAGNPKPPDLQIGKTFWMKRTQNKNLAEHCIVVKQQSYKLFNEAINFSWLEYIPQSPVTEWHAGLLADSIWNLIVPSK